MKKNIYKILNHSFFRWGITAGYAAMVIILSLLPGKTVSKMAPNLPYVDKWAHGILYAGFTLLFCWAVSPRLRQASWLAMTVAICLAYGLAVEALQHTTGIDRTFSWGDIAANTAGVISAVIVLALMSYKN